MSKVFRCKGCGEIDSIVEITLIPSIQTVQPDPADDHTPYEDVDYTSSDPDNFYEDAPVLGFGCRNERCTFWHGHHGYSRYDEQPLMMFDRAPDLRTIAKEVDE